MWRWIKTASTNTLIGNYNSRFCFASCVDKNPFILSFPVFLMIVWWRARAVRVGQKRNMTRFMMTGCNGTKRVLPSLFSWIRSRKIQWCLGENKKSSYGDFFVWCVFKDKYWTLHVMLSVLTGRLFFNVYARERERETDGQKQRPDHHSSHHYRGMGHICFLPCHWAGDATSY